MARRSGLRSTAAKSMTRLKGHEYDRHVSESLRQINQQAFAEKEKRSDARYAAAGQFLTTLDKMSAAKAQDEKAERGVTQMQKETGSEVQYKKSTLKGWMKGENKFRDIGKETFTFGDTEYSKADMIAYDKTYKKNKWEDIDFDQSDKNPVEQKVDDAKSEVSDPQDVAVDEGEMKPWTYEGQKTSDKEAAKVKKASDKQAFLEQDKKDKPWKYNKDLNTPGQQKRMMAKADRKLKRDERKAARLEKAELKEQGIVLAGKEGSSWDKFKSHFAGMFGKDKDIDAIDADRKDKGTSDKDTEYNPEVEPASNDELVEKYTEGTKEDFTKAVNLTEGGDVPTQAQADIDSDVSDSNVDKLLAKSPESEGGKDYWGDFKAGLTDDKGLFQGGEKGRVLGRVLDKFSKKEVQEVEDNKFGEQQKDALKKMLESDEQYIEEQVGGNEVSDKAIDTSLNTIDKQAKMSTAESYISKNQKFDSNVSAKSKNLHVGMHKRMKDEGRSMYSLYEGDKMIMEDAFQVKIDPETGMDTREMISRNPMLKGWKGFGGLEGMGDIGNVNVESKREPVTYDNLTASSQSLSDSLVNAANTNLKLKDDLKTIMAGGTN